jgi:hypothetical protein
MLCITCGLKMIQLNGQQSSKPRKAATPVVANSSKSRVQLKIGEQSEKFNWNENYPDVYIKCTLEKGFCLYAATDIHAKQNIFVFVGDKSSEEEVAKHHASTSTHREFLGTNNTVIKRPAILLYEHAAWTSNDALYGNARDGIDEKNNAWTTGAGTTNYKANGKQINNNYQITAITTIRKYTEIMCHYNRTYGRIQQGKTKHAGSGRGRRIKERYNSGRSSSDRKHTAA